MRRAEEEEEEGGRRDKRAGMEPDIINYFAVFLLPRLNTDMTSSNSTNQC